MHHAWRKYSKADGPPGLPEIAVNFVLKLVLVLVLGLFFWGVSYLTPDLFLGYVGGFRLIDPSTFAMHGAFATIQ